jgi:hypothetical protein
VKASWYGSSSDPTLAQLARSLAKLTNPLLKIDASRMASETTKPVEMDG